jgi:hypothetical protein
MHTQFDPSLSKDIIIMRSADVYNMMISETMIQENQHLIVYNIMQNGEHFVCHIKHVSFNNILFPKEQLMLIFSRLIIAPRTETFIISHDGTICQAYNMKEDLILKENIEIKINDIYDLVSIKPITYM